VIDNELFTQLKDTAANFIPAKHLDDVTQEVFMYLYEDAERLEQLIADKKIKWYFIRLCKNNYYSKTSKYYYKYNRPYKDVSFNDDIMKLGLKLKSEDLYFIQDSDMINDILSELYWYDRELFRLYVLGDNDGRKYTYTSLSKKTKISRMNIYITIKKVKEYIKERLKEKRNDL
jgi:DNA-directed RNA polymerase specialized sigma24 family protein|tara:strand:+ start:1680 stop:2201 length:522 start_codon:yes stop_codon:yes gene_type:complete